MKMLIVSLIAFLVLASASQSQSLWQPQNSNIPLSEQVLTFSPVNDRICWACTIDTNNTGPSGYIRTTDGGTTWEYGRIPGTADGIIGQIAALDADTAYAAVWVLNPSNTAGVYKTANGGRIWSKQNVYGPSTTRYGPGAIHFFDPQNGTVEGSWPPETYTTSDGGAHWTLASIPSTYSWEVYQSEIVYSNNCAWFVSTAERIFRTSDEGHTWSTTGLESQYKDYFPSIAFQDSSTGLLGQKLQEYLTPHLYRRTTDGGVTWAPLSSPILDNIAPTGIHHILGTKATYLVAGGMNAGQRGLAITYDAGNTWRLLDSTGALFLGFASDSVGWCSPHQHNNAVWKYIGPPLVAPVEETIRWVKQNSNTTRNLYAVSFSDRSIGVVVGDSGTILRTSDGGATWIPIPSGTLRSLRSIWFSDAYHGTTVGDSGTILRTIDGGNTWAPQSSGTSIPLRGVCFTDVNTGTVVGGGGMWKGPGILLHTADGGVIWVKQIETDSVSLNAVSFADRFTGTAVGGIGFAEALNYVILRTSDGGGTWRSLRTASIANIWGVHFINPDTGTVVGGYGVSSEMGQKNIAQIIHTTNGGATWTSQLTRQGGCLNGVWFITANIGTAVGGGPFGGSAILHTTDAGATWTPQSSGTTNTLRGIFFADANNGIVIGDSGTIYHTSYAITSVPEWKREVPAHCFLEQNYPNPFNPTTNIRYQTSDIRYLTLTVYDILGREVAVLVDERKAPGSYEVAFNAAGLSSGVYFYRLTGGGFVQSRKMIMLK